MRWKRSLTDKDVVADIAEILRVKPQSLGTDLKLKNLFPKLQKKYKSTAEYLRAAYNFGTLTQDQELLSAMDELAEYLFRYELNLILVIDPYLLDKRVVEPAQELKSVLSSRSESLGKFIDNAGGPISKMSTEQFAAFSSKQSDSTKQYWLGNNTTDSSTTKTSSLDVLKSQLEDFVQTGKVEAVKALAVGYLQALGKKSFALEFAGGGDELPTDKKALEFLVYNQKLLVDLVRKAIDKGKTKNSEFVLLGSKLAKGGFLSKPLQLTMSENKKLSLVQMLYSDNVFEKADPTNFDFEKFPLELSDVDPEEAADHVQLGQKDGDQKDDVIDVDKSSISVRKLKPSQSSMNIEKAVGMAISMINKSGPFKGGPGGDLGAFISSDSFIMDGHHRWIASFMVDPDSKIIGHLVEFPRKELIAVLNTISKGVFGVQKGKPATGGFEQFTFDGVKQTLEKFVVEGDGNFIKPDDVRKAAETFTGLKGDEAIEEMAEQFAENLDSATLEVPKDSPEREDMPVIDGDDIEQAVKLLKGGHVDVSEPYGVNEMKRSLVKDIFG